MHATASENTAATVAAADTTAAYREERKLAYRLLLDFLIFVVLSIPIIVCEFGIEPFRRGFFCNDESIRYPFLGNTVTPVMLGLLVGLLPVLIFIAVEFSRYYRRGHMAETLPFLGWQTPSWLIECSRHFQYFCFGLVLTFDFTELGKYTIGRLRPHFFAICQPQLSDGTTCSDLQNHQRYIENYICLGSSHNALDVRQARLSFPSGHSSLICYTMLYIAFYLQQRLSWRNSKLACHFLQFGLLLIAWFTALSRVMDNWHHWSDVLAGSIIGIVTALITAQYIAKLFNANTSLHMGALRVSIPRQDTSATLQDVIATPPPYCLNSHNSFSNSHNSFSNEEYCTKV